MEAIRISLEGGLTPLRVPRSSLKADHGARALLLGCALEYAEELDQLEMSARGENALREAALSIRVTERMAQTLKEAALAGKNPTEAAVLYASSGVQALAAAARGTAEAGLRERLEFLLPEQEDILYRLANLLFLESGEQAERLTGAALEIMPGRPCAAQHRHPADEVSPVSFTDDQSLYALFVLRSFAQKAAGIYGSLRDGYSLGDELSLLMRQQALFLASLEAGTAQADFLTRARYISALADELAIEDSPLLSKAARHAETLLQKAFKIEKKDALDIVRPEPCFHFQPCKGYLRELAQHAGQTLSRGAFAAVGELPDGAPFFRYQRRLIPNAAALPSHAVVRAVIEKTGADYRYELAPHPVEALRDRTDDSTEVGRKKTN